MTARVINADAREALASLPAKSAQCVVTSPPYWGLRDYGWSGQIGLEPTMGEFLANLVDVFAGVWRVLRDDGVLWVNMGDGYASNPASGGVGQQEGGDHQRTPRMGWTRPDGLKPKDLLGQPWRLALALQDAGWYLRSDCIWHKPNPMPESCTDRPTKSHEYVFLLTKRARYFYDADGVREKVGMETRRASSFRDGGQYTDGQSFGNSAPVTKATHGDGANGTGRNLRTVWTIATQSYTGSHFATFPEKLVRTCLKAGASEKGCCPECGAPWRRVVDVGPSSWEARKAAGHDPAGYHVGDTQCHAAGAPCVASEAPAGSTTGGLGWVAKRTQKGWRPTCAHDTKPIPCTVLDPFAGTGTVGLVAHGLGLDSILIEGNPEYVTLIEQRLHKELRQPHLFGGPAAGIEHGTT